MGFLTKRTTSTCGSGKLTESLWSIFCFLVIFCLLAILISSTMGCSLSAKGVQMTDPELKIETPLLEESRNVA